MFNLPVHSGWMAVNTHLPTAVLIDGENTSASVFPCLQTHLRMIAGIALIRVYGDFSNAAHAKWLDICRKEGLEAVLHCSPVTGKNGTDILMTISAMDILATAKFHRIVLVSSDSDFLPLVRRLRAGGMEVIGIGRSPTSEAQPAIYSRWLELGDSPASPFSKPQAKAITKPSPQPSAAFRKKVNEIIGESAVSLTVLGKALKDSPPDLAAEIGKVKLKKHIEAAGGFELHGQLVRRQAV
jgi:predicted nuclease of predicted toxin-antitoxin system